MHDVTGVRHGTHSCQCAAARALVLQAGAGWEDAAVGNDDHVLAAELLLQLANQALLDLVERLQQPVWDLQGGNGRRSGPVSASAVRMVVGAHMDDDCLSLRSLDLHLLCGCDVQVTKIGLQLGIGSLQIEKSLCT
jgi:hypothetical protein